MLNKQTFPWSRYLPAFLTLCLGVSLSVVACAVVWFWENKRRDYEFNRRLDDTAIALERQLNADLDVVLALGDYMAASPEVDRPAFARFVQRPLSVHPSLQAVVWSPRVPDAERQAWEANIRTVDLTDFEIVEQNEQGQLVTAGRRLGPGNSDYFPAHYIEPLAKNKLPLGFDLASQPTYRRALEKARDTGEMVIASQIETPSDQAPQLGLLAIQPVYQNGVNPPTLQLRRQLLQGFVLGIFRATDILQSSLRGRNIDFLDLYLSAQTPVQENSSASSEALTSLADPSNPLSQLSPGSLTDSGLSKTLPLLGFEALYRFGEDNAISPRSSGWDRSTPQGKPTPSLDSENQQALEAMVRKRCPIQQEDNSNGCRRRLKVQGRTWSLYVLATPEFRQTQKHWRSWGTLLIGLLWTHIPVTYLLTSLSRTTQIEKLAQEQARQAKQLQEAYQQLEVEQTKSEELLLNVLPQAIAERLKKDEHNIADSFTDVSVLFADIVGFTELSSRIAAPALVQVLNNIFSAFDHLAEKHGLEKIKTIGDAYMVVGGLPTPRADHAVAIAEMALDMQQEIRRFGLEHGEPFSIRIGINSGPVIAGVIGIKRFIYDLWGDTVNIASRMESHGITGCIQVTDTTYKLLQDKYVFEKRGAISIKGKGYMTTYLLLGRLPVPAGVPKN